MKITTNNVKYIGILILGVYFFLEITSVILLNIGIVDRRYSFVYFLAMCLWTIYCEYLHEYYRNSIIRIFCYMILATSFYNLVSGTDYTDLVNVYNIKSSAIIGLMMWLGITFIKTPIEQFKIYKKENNVQT